jgi:hypothetical protein
MKGKSDFPLFSSGEVTLSDLIMINMSDFPLFSPGEVTLSDLIMKG